MNVRSVAESAMRQGLHILAQIQSRKEGRGVSLGFLLDYAGIDKSGLAPDVKSQLERKVLQLVRTGKYVMNDTLAFTILQYSEQNALDVFRHGAMALVSNKSYEGHPCIVAENPMFVYARMANYYRSLSDADATAVVGSIGKTTAKLMLGAVYSQHSKTLYENGNYNNISRVLHLCQHLPKKYKHIICEVSEADPGTIEAASIALQPKVALITAIDKSHMEGYGDEEEIKRQVCSISKHLAEGGVIVVNKDEFSSYEYLSGKKIISVSLRGKADYYAENITADGSGLSFDIVEAENGNRHQVNMKGVHGIHNVGIALQVYASAIYLGMPEQKVVKGLESYRPEGIRQNAYRTLTGRWVYADCFNAVAKSIKSALEAGKKLSIGEGGRRIAVLADVEEAGIRSDETHRQIVDIANHSGFDILIAYGPKLNKALDEVKVREGLEVKRCNSSREVVSQVRKITRRGDLVLFKSSHSWHLEKCIRQLWPLSYYYRLAKEKLPYAWWRLTIELH